MRNAVVKMEALRLEALEAGVYGKLWELWWVEETDPLKSGRYQRLKDRLTLYIESQKAKPRTDRRIFQDLGYGINAVLLNNLVDIKIYKRQGILNIHTFSNQEPYIHAVLRECGRLEWTFPNVGGYINNSEELGQLNEMMLRAYRIAKELL